MIAAMHFTPTEQKIMDILSDGQLHTKAALHAVLPDTLGPLNNVRVHLTYLRRKLRPEGKTIAAETRDRVCYYRLASL